MLTFLWRFCGSPAPAGTGTLAGSYTRLYYASAVEWAEEQGLLKDCLAGFQPSSPCPRADVVQFLYLMGRKSAAECLEAYEDDGLFDGNERAKLTMDMVTSADLWTFGTWNDRPGEHSRLENCPEELARTLVWIVTADTPFTVGGLPHGDPMRNVRVSIVFDARTGTALEHGYSPGRTAEQVGA